ncbi:unnamed protein product [Diamesa serratosioi]
MQTFLNEFLITTTNFLNGFVSDVDQRFYEFDSKLSKIEGSLLIIEAKLASVPSRDENPIENLPEVPVSTTTNKEIMNEKVPEILQEVDSTIELSNKKDDNNNLIRICDDSLYKKYFKMLKVGVPLPAVKVKMGAEGLNGNLLDNPDLMIEPSPETNK